MPSTNGNSADKTQAQNKFLAQLMEEVRGSLETIVGFGHLMMEDDGITPDLADHVKTICTTTQSMQDIVHDLHSFMQLQSKTRQLMNINFNLESLIVQTAKAAEFKHKVNAKVRVEQEYDNKLPKEFKGDPKALEDVLLNLIMNGLRYTHEGEVRIVAIPSTKKFEKNQQGVKVIIRDTGKGIPKDKINNMFESYLHSDYVVTRNSGGTGLGLAITKSLVHLMGGELSVDSKEGEGTEFAVEIPLTLKAAS